MPDKIATLQKNSNRFSSLFVLVAAYVILHLVLLARFGIVTGYEAEKYLEQADSLLATGHYTSPNFLYYSVQIVLIAATKKVGLGYWFVVLIQVLFNAASVWCFYRLVLRFGGSARVAQAFSLALIGMFYYQLYNVHLFTESLYFSFSVMFFFGLVHLNRLTWRSAACVLFGLALLYFTRPVGIFFLPASFVYLVFRFWPKRAALLLLTAGAAALLLLFLLLNLSLSSGGDFDFLLPYSAEMIICGVPTVKVPHTFRLPVEQNSVQGLFYLLTHHAELVLRLAGRRLLAFFGAMRSYYTLPHNLFIAAYFYTLYVAIFAGFRNWTKNNRAAIGFILTLVFFTALTTALSCDEWHNRFLFTLLPFLLLLGSLAFSRRTNTDAVPTEA